MYTWLGNTDVISTDVNDELPFQYSLDQNYPNPFNPATQIKYSIAKAGIVTLKVYDILVVRLADLVNKYQEAGKYTVYFNASHLASVFTSIELRAVHLLMLDDVDQVIKT